MKGPSWYVKCYRVGRGLTQEALALKLGVTPRTIQHWESGTRETPRMAVKLLQAMDSIECLEDELEQYRG